MLSEAQIESYREHGYVVADFRLPDSVLDDLREGQKRLVARHRDFRDICPNLLAYDLRFLEIARTPEILDMVAQLIGPDFALWNSSLFSKPARNGQRTPWHQDGQYWPIRPLATCTVWIALDDSTPENGCLRVIPGSHHERRLRAHRSLDAKDVTLGQELEPSEFDPSTAKDIVLKAGQMSLHDVYLLHSSEANGSPQPRRGMTLRFMPTTSRLDRDLATQLAHELNVLDHADRTLFLMRGVDRSGRNDFRVRN
jgi:ectoine hydroxylase-related dioxygenase (phytanoyl-CoA dioxygenase family)